MPCEVKNRDKLRKFLVASKNIPSGKILKSDDITAKRTGGTGLQASNYFDVINKKSWKSFKKNEPIIK